MEPPPNHKKKPIDLWLGLFGGIALPILLYLFPKTQEIVSCLLVLMFLALIHPVWKFWWIEDYLPRQIMGLLLLSLVLSIIGFEVPYEVPAEVPPKSTFRVISTPASSGQSNGTSTRFPSGAPRGILPPANVIAPVGPAASLPKTSKPPKPRLDIDVDVSLLSSISDAVLRGKVQGVNNLLIARWYEFDHADNSIVNRLSDSAHKPASKQLRAEQAKLKQTRIQLRVEVTADIKLLLPKASALRDEAIKRFGASDGDARNLKGILERFADLADYEEGH